MLSKTDLHYARTCSQCLQMLYEFVHEWYKLHGLHVPFLPYFQDEVLRLHTQLDQFVTAWDYQPKSDENHVSNVSGSSQFNGNF